LDEVKAIADDIAENEIKINHHGKRADAIVKGMLQHSRSSNGIKEPTDINALADEYLRLSYHGLRAKDKSFNAGFKTDFDPELPKIEVIPQDLGRVLLNLINNAFYACAERSRIAVAEKNRDVVSAVETRHALSQQKETYKPRVTITTKNLADKIEISVGDNGNGIPDSIKDKIFQPFFTTKPTGQGTGLGLSMSYDIISKGHGGELKVKTKIGEGTDFIIQLSTKILNG
jgi:signal transduction histidine kinase